MKDEVVAWTRQASMAPGPCIQLQKTLTMLPRRELAVVLGMLGAILLCGCWRGDESGGNWSSSMSSVSEPGAEYALVLLKHDGRPYLLLAIDIHGQARLSGGTGHYQGRFARNTPARSLEWSCSTTDGIHGQIRIAGQHFDLARGGLFLVNTACTPPAVIQVVAPLEILQEKRSPYKFSEAARDHPDIARFLRSSSVAARQAGSP